MTCSKYIESIKSYNSKHVKDKRQSKKIKTLKLKALKYFIVKWILVWFSYWKWCDKYTKRKHEDVIVTIV